MSICWKSHAAAQLCIHVLIVDVAVIVSDDDDNVVCCDDWIVTKIKPDFLNVPRCEKTCLWGF